MNCCYPLAASIAGKTVDDHVEALVKPKSKFEGCEISTILEEAKKKKLYVNYVLVCSMTPLSHYMWSLDPLIIQKY